jgi:hypothetical protein
MDGKGAAQAAAVSADSRTTPMFVRPDVVPGTSFTIASAEQEPFLAKLPRPVEPRPDVVPIAAALSVGRFDGTPAAAPEGSLDAPAQGRSKLNRKTAMARGASAP